MSEPNLRQVGERIEALVQRIGESSDLAVRGTGEELVRMLLEYYGAALERILDLVYDGPGGAEAIDRIGDDQLAGSVLVLHGLHPVALEERIASAIDHVRPYLGSHGGGVEVVAIDGDLVRLRLEGSCDGCPSSTVTLHYALEKAILEAAPEISRVEAEAAPEVHAGHTPPLIQLEPRSGRNPGSSNGRGHDGIRGPATAAEAARVEWVQLDPFATPGPGRMSAVDLDGVRVLLCSGDDATWAYVDRCSGCGARFESARFEPPVLWCSACGRSFDLRAAGREIGGDGLHLDPLPMLADAMATRIAVPALR